MVVFPRAKINIGLQITEKRSDGFHNIETIFYPCGLCDALEFVVPGEFLNDDDLVVTGLLAHLDPTGNLVLKAVRRIRELKKIPYLRIHLHKAIPAGAGLGGGSSDASAILKALDNYFNLELGNKLKNLSLELGSDCPFFLGCTPSFGRGRGEILETVQPLQDGLHLVVVNPMISINTREAYSNITPKHPDSDLKELYNLEISQWKNLIINDFEETIFKRHPVIAEVKKRLYETGAVYSSMSGSGSAVYGIFYSKPVIPDDLKARVIYSGEL